MLFVILGVIIAIAMMCLPIVAMFIVKKRAQRCLSRLPQAWRLYLPLLY